jgi:hypothetical protein
VAAPRSPKLEVVEEEETGEPEAAGETPISRPATRRRGSGRGRRAAAREHKSVAAKDTPGDALLPPSWKE